MTERIEVLNKDDVICIIYADYASCNIHIENLVEQSGLYIFLLPFGINNHPTWADYMYYLSTRCFPANRGDAGSILKGLGLREHNPDAIVRKSHGVMNDDFVWLRYPGETLKFEDVRMR